MQVFVGGMPAKAESSTLEWQKRQSSPMSCTWCLWLNGTGCSRATSTCVVYDERRRRSQAHAPPARKNSAPKIETFESVLKLGWKIWGIARGSDLTRAGPRAVAAKS